MAGELYSGKKEVPKVADQGHSGGVIDWFSDTVIHPVVNAAVIDSYNTVSRVVQDVSAHHLSLGEITPLSVNKATAYSASWFVESAAGGLGSILPYVVAGKLTGGVMRRAAPLIGAEGATLAALNSDRCAQLVGAGIYAGMKRPENGETRLSNAVSTAAGFAMFDYGNSFNRTQALQAAGWLPAFGRAGVRLGTGFAAGVAQTELNTLLSQDKLAPLDQVVQNGVGSAFINVGLGTAQDAAGRAIDSISKLGRQLSDSTKTDAVPIKVEHAENFANGGQIIPGLEELGKVQSVTKYSNGHTVYDKGENLQAHTFDQPQAVEIDGNTYQVKLIDQIKTGVTSYKTESGQSIKVYHDGLPIKRDAADSQAEMVLHLPEHDNLLHVPMVRQATNYTCGVAALQSILAYFGQEWTEDALAKKLKADPEDGTRYAEIERFAKKHGYDVHEHRNMALGDLEHLLDNRHPVMLLIQAWADKKTDYAKDWDDGHYVVAIGYDSQRVYFMDPSTLGSYTYIPKAEFLNRWHDTDGKEYLKNFGLLISKGKPTYDEHEIKKMD